MLLFFLLGVIANVALFCDGCSVGPRDVINFDWIKVRISVLTVYLKQTTFKTVALVLYVTCGTINELSIVHVMGCGGHLTTYNNAQKWYQLPPL